jgi:hypothetical protein
MTDSNQAPETKIPLWVFLAFSSIQKRNHALILIWACIIFSIYSLPWSTFINNDLVSTLFLIEDWSWIAMMIPISAWYILSLRWMDTNDGWEII